MSQSITFNQIPTERSLIKVRPGFDAIAVDEVSRINQMGMAGATDNVFHNECKRAAQNATVGELGSE